MDKLNTPPPRPVVGSFPPPGSLPATPSDKSSDEEIATLCREFAELDVPRNKRTCCQLLGKMMAQSNKGSPLFAPNSPFAVQIYKNLRTCAHTTTPTVREFALRALRYLCPTAQHISLMLAQSISIAITISLERSPDMLQERVLALKLAQHIAAVSPRLVPPNVIRSLVMIASEPSDNLRRPAVETIRNISVHNVPLVAHANGFRVLTAAVLEPDLSDLAESILMTLMFLMNEGQTRMYLRPNLDLDVLLSPFTDFSKNTQNVPAQAAREERIGLSSKAVVTMMRSWTGLIALTSTPTHVTHNGPSFTDLMTQYEPQSVASVISDAPAYEPSHYTPVLAPLDLETPPPLSYGEGGLLTALTGNGMNSTAGFGNGGGGFMGSQDAWPPANVVSSGLASLINALLLPTELNDEVRLHDHIFRTLADILQVAACRSDGGEMCGLPPRWRGHSVIHNYSAMVLLALIHAGAVETLTITGKSLDEHIAQQSTELLGRMLVLASTLLPPTHCARLHSLSDLVGTAASFELEPIPRLRANKMLTDLHVVSRNTLAAVQHSVAMQGTTDDPNPSLNTFSLQAIPSQFWDFTASANGQQSSLNGSRAPRPSILNSRQGMATRFHLDLLLAETTKWRRTKGMDSTGDRIEWVKRKLDSSMDDAKFNALLLRSNVSVTKDTERWQWNIIIELLEGALLNPSRMKEAMATKFFKRLLSFMRPSKKLLCMKVWSSDKMHYVRALCRVMDLLTQTDDGIAYLKNSDVFQQMNKHLVTALESTESGKSESGVGSLPSLAICTSSSSSLASLATSVTQSSAPSSREWCMFDAESVAHTMSREYLTIMGFLTKSRRGLALLQNIGLIKTLIRVTESDRDDLNKLLISNLDYNTDEQCRAFLLKLVTARSKPVRLHATRHIRVMLRAGVPGFDKWGIESLTTQLYDGDEEVRTQALDVLAEACVDAQNLNTLVRHRPSLKHLGAKGRDMMLRMLRTEAGIRLLDDMQWIPDEMERWYRQANVEYVTSVEVKLIAVLNSQGAATNQFSRDDVKTFEGDASAVVPPHFYGELAHTPKGVEILKASNHVNGFVDIVRGGKSALQVRAALWALGHIASSLCGLQFAQEHGVVRLIVRLAQYSECLSIRGTCCYVLGLVAATQHGRQVLSTYNWLSPPSVDTHVSVPRFPDRFFYMPTYGFMGSPTRECPDFPTMPLTAEEMSAFTQISNLSNSVTKKAAMEALNTMKRKRAPALRSTSLFLQTHEMLAFLNFPLTTRRFIHDLFSEIDITQLDKFAPPSFVVSADD